MSRYKYDLHIHSCLSPCADDDMTPGNIAGMAVINGLSLVALTDHNTTKNCPAFFSFAKSYGIVPLAGMELTTAEDIHVICLFPTLDGAMNFGTAVDRLRVRVKNRPDIFGNQNITDENDEIIGREEDLLINSTTLDIEDAYKLCDSYGGVCYPAHIDRTSNGIVAVLGTFPESPSYTAFELNDSKSYGEYLKNYPILGKLRYIVSSDAHRLTAISEGDNFLELCDDVYSSQNVRNALIAYLKGI